MADPVIVGWQRRFFEYGTKGFDGSCFNETCLAEAKFAVVNGRAVRAYCLPHAAWYAMRHHVARMPLTLHNAMRGAYEYYGKEAKDETEQLRAV